MTLLEFNKNLVGLKNSLEIFAQKLTYNKEDARDLTQETFVRAISYRNQFAADTNLKAWTYTIMKNTFINNYRRKIKANITFDNTDDLYFLNLGDETVHDDPVSSYSKKEIESHIEQLEDELRIPFEMYLQGYKYREIADQLGMKLGTVKSRIYSTRKRLAETLHEYN